MTAPTTDDLREALDSLLGGGTLLARRPYPYRTSFALEELEVEHGDGSLRRLVFKNLGDQGLEEHASAVRPPFLHDPRREIDVYTSVLARHDLGTAAYYGSVVDAERDRFWLFLEWVDGAQLWQVGDLDTWSEVARWLARMHDWIRPPRRVALAAYDLRFYRRWLPRAISFTPGAGLERLASRYETVVARLAAAPTAFVHGDFSASNVLVAETRQGMRICPVDWELAGIGTGLLDLASLSSGFGPDESSALVSAYREALVSPPAPEVFEELLDCCRLHLAVQWLGWSAEWMPPVEHAHDWAAQAFAAAERLELVS